MRFRLFTRRGRLLPSGLLSPRKNTRWIIGSAILGGVVAVGVACARRWQRQALDSTIDSGGGIPDSDSPTPLPRALESPTIAASPDLVPLPIAELPVIDSGAGNDPDLAVMAATDVLPSPQAIATTPSFRSPSADVHYSPDNTPIADSPFAALKQAERSSAPVRQVPRRIILHRLMLAAVLVVSSIAVVYGALGAIKSHNNKRPAPDLTTAGPIFSPTIAETRATTDVAEAAAPNAAAADAAEPAPPAENDEVAESVPTPAASATPVPKTRAHSRTHKTRSRTRAHKSTTETGSMLPRIH